MFGEGYEQREEILRRVDVLPSFFFVSKLCWIYFDLIFPLQLVLLRCFSRTYLIYTSTGLAVFLGLFRSPVELLQELSMDRLALGATVKDQDKP